MRNNKEQKTRKTTQKMPSVPQWNNNIKKPNLYGLHAVREAWLNEDRIIHALYISHMAQRQFDEIVLQAKKMGLRRPDPIILDKPKFERMLPKGAVHQGVALACAPLEEMDVQDLIILTHDKKRSVVAILDQVTDPHNVGAIMRSASAFGLDGLLMQTKHAPELEGVLAKTACGAVEHIPVAYATNLSRALEELQEAGFTALAMDERGDKEIGELQTYDKIVIVLGSEGSGIRPLIKDKCDVLARLPTSGAIASLNVSNAAAVAFYALMSGVKS
jgi:23S rRNA (guanosine2251-2'-O)-methyltransferase